MLLNLKCPSCGRTQRASREIIGKVLLCPSCGGSFHVSGPKPDARASTGTSAAPAGPPALPETRPRLTATPPEPCRNPAPSRVMSPSASRSTSAASMAPASASARRLDPPALPAVDRSANPHRESLPPWIYGALGSAAILAVASMVILTRSLIVAGPGRPPQANPAVSPVSSPTVEAPPRAQASAPAAAPATAPVPAERRPLTTAEVVARCEPSVALVKGKASSGTGFLVRPGVIATNAHVISHEFLSDLEVRFPSAPAGRKGPSRVILLDEDPRRDLAFLAVESPLPALEVAPSYRFVKGEDITVIGSPGLGDATVLENAISRGVMSSKIVLDGLNYLQLNIAINPGNSGGPVFDSAGRVIGVATLKSTKAEAMAFCIPVEDLHAGLARLDARPPAARAAIASRHGNHLALRLLTTAGALYAVGLDVRAGILQATRQVGPGTDLLPNEQARKLHEVLSVLEQKQFSLVPAHLGRIQADPALSEATRRAYRDLTANYQAMRDLYNHPSPPAKQYASRAEHLRANHLRLVRAIQNAIKAELPGNLLAVLESRPAAGQPPLVADMIPAPMQPQLPSFPAPNPRVPFGPRSRGGFDPAADARARMQELHERAQQRIREMQERSRAFRPRFGP